MRTIAILLTLGVLSAFADEPNVDMQEKARKSKAAFERFQMKHFGGKVPKPGSQRGRVVFVDAQERISTSGLQAALKKMTSVPHFDIRIDIVKGAQPQMSKIREWREDNNANIAVFLVDNPDLPPTLSAYEERWGLVNVSAIAMSTPDAKFLGRNVEALALRVFADLAGGADSQFPSNIMSITDIPGLDNIEGVFIPVDTLNKLQNHLPRLGVTPTYVVNYITAVKAGWAPAPTNEYQKAIWDKIHAMPTAPIKIKPESKKVSD